MTKEREFYASKTCAGQGAITDLSTGRSVAIVYDIADTQFLAAGPVMLAALQKLLDVMEPPRSRKASEAWDEARQAIRAATVCDHDHRPDGTTSGGCIGLVCTWCGDVDERDVS